MLLLRTTVLSMTLRYVTRCITRPVWMGDYTSSLISPKNFITQSYIYRSTSAPPPRIHHTVGTQNESRDHLFADIDECMERQNLVPGCVVCINYLGSFRCIQLIGRSGTKTGGCDNTGQDQWQTHGHDIYTTGLGLCWTQEGYLGPDLSPVTWIQNQNQLKNCEIWPQNRFGIATAWPPVPT